MSQKSNQFLRAATGAMIATGLALAASSAAKAQQFKWPKYFSVITPIVGSSNHSLGVAWSTTFSADTGVRVRILPTSSGYSRTEWLNTNQGRLTVYQPSDFFDQMDSVEGYAKRTAGPSDTRAMFVLAVTPWGYMVRGDSKIKTVDDITAKTKVVFYSGSTFISNGMRALLALAGVKEADANKVEVGGYGANTKVVSEGRGDVSFTSPVSGTSYAAEAAPNSIRWLAVPTGHKNFAAFREMSAGYVLTKASSGVKTAVGTPMDHAFQSYHVRGNENADFVYRLAKWMDENHDSYKKKFRHAPMMSMVSLKAYLNAGILEPFHDGLIRYLKEKGIWTAAHQKRNDTIVRLMKNRIEVFDGAMEAAHKAKVLTDSPNDKWKAFLADYKMKNGVTMKFSKEIEAATK